VLNPSNKKKHHKNSQNSGKIFRFLQIPQIFFSNCVAIKNFMEKISEILQHSRTKRNLPENFSDFQKQLRVKNL
jgi:hypothetical protein